MKNKTQLIFVIGASAAGVLIAGCAVLLFMSRASLKKTELKIDAKQMALEYLYASNPFPSEKNVKVELQNGTELRQWLSTLATTAGEGQLDLDMRTPSKFRRLLDQTVKRLQRDAGDEVVPRSFRFGFGHYLEEGSELPQPQHVPRLAQQLAVVERVCDIMFSAGITRLVDVTRENFEGTKHEMLVAGTTATAGEIGTDDLYAKLSFTVVFEGPESSFTTILNQVSSNDLFMSVGTIDYKKGALDVDETLIPEPGRASLNAADDGSGDLNEIEVEVDDQGRLFPSRYRRIVSGKNNEVPMNVTLELNVYRFAKITSGNEEVAE